MIHRKRRVDANQADIVRALQAGGFHVTDLAGVGQGVPDLLITKSGLAWLIEIKNKAGRNRFTPAQIDYYAAVRCPVYVIRSVNDVELLFKQQLEPINGRSNPKKARTVHD